MKRPGDDSTQSIHPTCGFLEKNKAKVQSPTKKKKIKAHHVAKVTICAFEAHYGQTGEEFDEENLKILKVGGRLRGLVLKSCQQEFACTNPSPT